MDGPGGWSNAGPLRRSVVRTRFGPGCAVRLVPLILLLRIAGHLSLVDHGFDS